MPASYAQPRLLEQQSMARPFFSVVFSGSGGAGAMSAGELLLRAAAEAGYYGVMSRLYGAQVRGGEAAALVHISTEPVSCQPDRFDLFVALDWEHVDQFAPEIPLDDQTIILADPQSGATPASIAKSGAKTVAFKMFNADATPLERALQGKHINVFAAGAVAALAGLPAPGLHVALATVLGGKNAQAKKTNSAALDAGIAASAALDLDLRLAPSHTTPRWLLTGNQALAVGALRGGVRFAGCYPITPATDLVEWLAPQIAKLGGRLALAEDELAAINMVLGASFGGVPAMTVTSGPGLSLMIEGIGLGIAAEIPAVIIDVMRGGPSTGIPSKTEQSDVNIAIYGGHGDAPRVVVAPTSVRDCMFTGEWAVYLAESLQSPVIVLSDMALGQTLTVVDPKPERPQPLKRRTDLPEGPFKRYAIGPDPVTPMPRPGTPHGQWVGEGLTHNEIGIPVGGASAHAAQLDKRARKFAQFDPGNLWGEVWGEGDTAILTFGSGIGPAQEAARRLKAAGKTTRVVSLRVLSPLPISAIAHALDGAKRIVVMEQNHSAQLYHHLLAHKAIPSRAESIARPGPLPFRPAEIAAHLV
jgi:2-oxoglutarate ferredoxin oxidoreductase subunit alpha